MTMTPALSDQTRQDAATLWSYLRVDDDLQPADVGLGLGSDDIGSAIRTAQLYAAGMFPRIVFSGANSPTTIDRFPRGEAIHYRDQAVDLGVPADAIFVETDSTSTAENITNARQLLADHDLHLESVILVSRPYQQRYAYGVARKLWPEVHLQVTAEQVALSDYLDHIGDANRVLSMMVGDVQRIAALPDFGLAVPQEIPPTVLQAYWRLVDAGYTSRIIAGASPRPRGRVTTPDAPNCEFHPIETASFGGRRTATPIWSPACMAAPSGVQPSPSRRRRRRPIRRDPLALVGCLCVCQALASCRFRSPSGGR